MTDPAFQANATAAGFTFEQNTLLETAVREAVTMSRQERDQLSAQLVQLQQQLAAPQQQQQAIYGGTRHHLFQQCSSTFSIHPRQIRRPVSSSDDCAQLTGSTREFRWETTFQSRHRERKGQRCRRVTSFNKQWTEGDGHVKIEGYCGKYGKWGRKSCFCHSKVQIIDEMTHGVASSSSGTKPTPPTQVLT
eukprot:5786143-Amphidinium_carterae.1